MPSTGTGIQDIDLMRVREWPSADAAEQAFDPATDGPMLAAYFVREGFAVIREAVPPALCEQAVGGFAEQVRPDRGYFMRHQSSDLERHVFTECGFMKYPIMNVQDLTERRFGRFRMACLDALTSPKIQQTVAAILGEPARLIHTMYFDGNQTTWAHRDGSYIDATSGQMIGLWLALEDIDAGAGRFFVVPHSHETPVPGERELAEKDPNGAAYKAAMARFVASGPLEVMAPALRQGDVIVWSSRTIHGSLPTTDQTRSRKSLTGHYVGRSQNFGWQVESRTSGRSTVFNDMPVVLHGQRNLRNLLRVKYVTPLRRRARTAMPWLHTALRGGKG